MSKTPIEITPTEITDKILQENTRLAERAHDVERISAVVKAENVIVKTENTTFKSENATLKKQICDLKKELIRIELLGADLVKETDMIEIVYDADLPKDVKKVVKKRAPKKPVVKEMTLVNSVDVPPVVKEECPCPCLATDESAYNKFKKPELIEYATGIGLRGIKKLTRSGIIEAIAKHENDGVKPIMDMVSV
jgi:hypothetical protein